MLKQVFNFKLVLIVKAYCKAGDDSNDASADNVGVRTGFAGDADIGHAGTESPMVTVKAGDAAGVRAGNDASEISRDDASDLPQTEGHC